MTTYLVFGLGMMGEAICWDIMQNDVGSTIHVIEVSQSRIDEIRVKWKEVGTDVRFHCLSITTDVEEVKRLLSGSDIAFGAIDYSFNLKLTEWCIEFGTHFLDLGGNPDVVNKQHALNERAKEAGIVVIPDCGLAPGMVNVLACGLLTKFTQPTECHLRVGGLPQDPVGILKYQQVFSIRGLTNEYKEDAFVIRDGEIVKVPGMTELETLYFPPPFGEMEAFQTAGGTSSLPKLFEHKIEQLTYKTIRYPGHMKYFRFLLDFDLLSEVPVDGGVTPRAVVEEKLVEHLPRNQPDVVLIRIYVTGEMDGRNQSITWECIDYSDDNFSAMARTTAYPISIIGQMIANGSITDRGVRPGELAVPFDAFVSQLSLRGIEFKKTSEDLY